MGFGTQTRPVQPESQATPLAEDLLAMLQGHLASSAFGTGVGPLQRQAGDALSRFVEQREGGQLPGNVGELFDTITTRSNIQEDRSAADLRERSSLAGNTAAGSGSLNSEALLRSEFGTSLDQTLAQLGEQIRQFETQSLLAGIQGLQQFGNQNIAPILQMAAMGILPEEIIASPGVGSQILGAVSNVAAGWLGGGGGGFALPGGGGPPTIPNPGPPNLPAPTFIPQGGDVFVPPIPQPIG